MPVYDFECDKCHFIEERILPIEECNRDWQCSCGGVLRRIMTLSGVNTSNEDAEWIRSVAVIVDKEGDVHDQRFLKSGMTRTDLKRWMKDKGLRHMDPGEIPNRPDPVNHEKIQREVWMKHNERMSLEVSGVKPPKNNIDWRGHPSRGR